MYIDLGGDDFIRYISRWMIISVKMNVEWNSFRSQPTGSSWIELPVFFAKQWIYRCVL